MLVYLRKFCFSPSFLKDNFTGYIILGCFLSLSLSQHFKYFASLFSSLCGFYDNWRNSYICFFIAEKFSSLTLASFMTFLFVIYFLLIFCCLKMICLALGDIFYLFLFDFDFWFLHVFCLVLSELPGTEVWFLILIWGNSQALLF